METLIGVIGGGIAAAAIYFLRKIGGTMLVKKYGLLIEKAYQVLDPIAGQLMSDYSGSEVQKAIELIVARVGDSNLDEADVVAISNYVIAKFNPALAAAKTLDAESEEGKAALGILEDVKKLHDGVSWDEVVSIAKNAKALF